MLAASAGRMSLSAAIRCVAPCAGSWRVSPVTSRHSATWVCPRRRNPLLGSWTATRESTQSRLRACSIATSKTTPVTPTPPEGSLMVTVRSSIWPITSVSVERCSKRRMLSSPVVCT